MKWYHDYHPFIGTVAPIDPKYNDDRLTYLHFLPPDLLHDSDRYLDRYRVWGEISEIGDCKKCCKCQKNVYRLRGKIGQNCSGFHCRDGEIIDCDENFTQADLAAGQTLVDPE